MKSVALLYHDVVRDGEFSSSGFDGADANIYKLDVQQFRCHLDAVAETGRHPLITVDDGGVSALETIAPMLEAKRFFGCFFIATDFIDRRGFLSRNQIRELRRRGHLIGSHSCSHPERISHCSWENLLDEWKRSSDILSYLLEEPVRLASVPGGFYSPRVARAAADAGCRVLFTSDPTTVVHQVDGCAVVGRFTLRRTSSPELAAAFARADWFPILQQALLWKAKKCAKTIGGTAWLQFRKWALQETEAAPEAGIKRRITPKSD
jgi:peptidoglycan/xylan/chitin deacetylase (PgdA/CDA1 family)